MEGDLVFTNYKQKATNCAPHKQTVLWYLVFYCSEGDLVFTNYKLQDNFLGIISDQQDHEYS